MDLLNGESHGETNVQAARARVRLVRAAAAKVASLWISFFFCHVQAAPCARLTMEPFLLLSNFSSCVSLYLLEAEPQLYRTGTQDIIYILELGYA